MGFVCPSVNTFVLTEVHNLHEDLLSVVCMVWVWKCVQQHESASTAPLSMVSVQQKSSVLHLSILLSLAPSLETIDLFTVP